MRVPSKQILKANYAKYKKESEKILATLKQIETISGVRRKSTTEVRFDDIQLERDLE